jgi:hypothetical protein
LLGLLIALSLLPDAEAAKKPPTLSKRAELRYEDVITTRDGTRWRGKLIEKGDFYRIRLDDNSEIVIPRADVDSVTRELHPGFPHQGQWGLRAGLGLELGVRLADSNAGLRYGPDVSLSVSRSFGGSVEPEINFILSPMGTEQGNYTWQIAFGSRVYFQPERRAKPFASTQFILTGAQGDLGLRTGPGFQWDWSPNAGIGFVQGFELISQLKGDETEEGSVAAVALGYHFMIDLQVRF